VCVAACVEVLQSVLQRVLHNDDSEINRKIYQCLFSNRTFNEQDTICESNFRIFSFSEPDEILSEDQKYHNLINNRWRALKPFNESHDDSDEDSDDIDSNDTLSDEDSDNDSLSEMSAFSENITSSDSEDGAGHHFFRKKSFCDENDQDSDFGESLSSDDGEDIARSSCCADGEFSSDRKYTQEESNDGEIHTAKM